MVSFPKARFTTAWFTSRYFGIKSLGAENIPETGPFVIVSNHASNLDPYMIGFTSSKREVGFMAKEELFRIPIFGWTIKYCGAFPVRRGMLDEVAIQKFHDFLHAGKPLVVFVEGTRTLDGNLQPAKKGVGLLLYNAKVPVIPAYIDGTFKSMPKGSFFPKPGKITVTYGPAIPLEDLYSETAEKPTYRRIAERVTEYIGRLRPIPANG
jgi:1-acyl-sn-glycerol-3-phosphate acyltransferase